MKRLVFSFFLFATCLCSATAQNDAMYVYRNDGVINAFLKADVDSMRCSQIDLDSIIHSEYVVQEVYTADSVYRIPLAMIDSIGFVTPKTVYQPGTVNMTAEMRDYVVVSDSLLLVFADNTPLFLLPHVGDKLVNTAASGGLSRGFLGKVTEISKTSEGYVVKCDPIEITDVFECYYGFSHGEEQQTTRGLSDGYYPLGFVWEPGKVTRSLFTTLGSGISYEPDGNLLVPSIDDAEYTVSLTPRLESRSYLIVNKDYGVNLSVSLFGDYTLEEYLSLSGSLTGDRDIKFFDEPLIRFPEILCDVVIEAGAFLRGTIQVSTQQRWKQRYKSTFHWEYSSKGYQSLKNVNDMRNVENSHSGIVAIKGNFETGLYLEAGLAFVATHSLDIAEIGLRVEGGVHFDGTALPYLSNKEDAMRSPDLYNMMKGQGVELSSYYGTSAVAKLFAWSWNKPIPNYFNIPFGKKFVWKSCYYVPEFKNTKLSKDSDGNYFASMDIWGNCVTTDIGFSLQNKDSYKDKVDGYCVYDYNGPSASAYSTFYSKPSKEPVVVYPLVKFGELEMIAEPSAELTLHTCPDDNHPHAIDLGLPSGTKWCCCNVGASTPEGYGGYYAWGETSEKSVYNWNTYAFYNQATDKYINIGSDISGTQYDVAYVRMGGPWRMPTYEQQKELMNTCTRQWTQQNGVNGILITGSNGGQIFLPAAGYRGIDDLRSAGSYGGYWSSSLGPDFDGYAYYLNFYSGNWFWDCYYRYYGLSVRPVCP